MDFIQRLRDDPQDAPNLPLGDDLHEVVRLGEQMGYEFSVDDLRAAFRHDWQMRWLRFGVPPQG
jgi:hypothetical protein